MGHDRGDLDGVCVRDRAQPRPIRWRERGAVHRSHAGGRRHVDRREPGARHFRDALLPGHVRVRARADEVEAEPDHRPSVRCLSSRRRRRAATGPRQPRSGRARDRSPLRPAWRTGGRRPNPRRRARRARAPPGPAAPASGAAESTRSASPLASMRGSAIASPIGMPRSVALRTIWVTASMMRTPPAEPTASTGRPSRRTTSGVMLWRPRRPGAMEIAVPGSGLNHCIALLSRTPVPGTTTALPKLSASVAVRLTTVRSRSTAIRWVVDSAPDRAAVGVRREVQRAARAHAPARPRPPAAPRARRR